jgi:hypothetical protein
VKCPAHNPLGEEEDFVGLCDLQADEFMAERGGFEPPVEFLTLRRFSKPLLSATQAPLREIAGRTPRMLARRGADFRVKLIGSAVRGRLRTV